MGTELPKLACEACNKNEAVGVACVPGVPMSVAYCQECLQANNHPMPVLIANTACIGGLNHAAEFWKKMVSASLKHQGKTLEWFNEEVKESMNMEGVEFTSEPVFINPKFNPEWAKPHGYEHSPGYPDDQFICICGELRDSKVHN